MQLLLWLCLCLLLLICQSSPSQASEYICTRARNSTSSHPIPPRYSEHPTGGARGMRPPERRMALQAELLLLAPRRQARKGMWQQQVALQLLRRRDAASAPAAASLPLLAACQPGGLWEAEVEPQQPAQADHAAPT